MPLCDHSSPITSSSGSSAAITSSCQQAATSAVAEDTAARGRRLRVEGEGIRYSSSPLSSASNHRLLQESDHSTSEASEDIAGGGESWAWNEDGPTFGLGELSRIRLSSHALLLNDGRGESWAALRNTSSATAAVVADDDEEDDGRAGVITASLESFGVEEAVISTMVFFKKAEAVEEASGGGADVLSDSE